MVARRINRRALGIAAAAAIASVPVFFVLRFLAMAALEEVGLVGSRYVVAEYDDMAFRGTGKNHLSMFWTRPYRSNDVQAVPSVYIVIYDHAPVFLPKLREELVARYWDRRDDLMHREGEVLYYSTGNSFTFKDGRLVELTCSNPAIRFGPTRDGPFLNLPTNKEDLIRVFGRPKRWKHGREKPRFF